MAIRFDYSIKSMDGILLRSYFGDTIFSDYIGRSRMERFPIFEMMVMNVTEGEIGSLFVSPEYGWGETGYWEAGIPQYMSIRLDY